MQPPVNTSAVRASTYDPLIEVPEAPRAARGAAINAAIIVAATTCFMTTSFAVYRCCLSVRG
jgi:hypothetical protein